jgi:choline dehydrogenase
MACLDAAAEQGHPLAADISGGLEVGFGLLDLNIVGGRRQSAADAYLRPVLARPNLEVVTDALVHRLHIAGDRCTGVVYSTGHELISAGCSGEVILTAGSIGSAQLLMVSGIGPAEHLEQVGVDVVLDLPGVGSNFHDHPITNVVYRSTRPVPAARNNHGEAFGLLRSDPGLETPDFQILFLDAPGHLATAVEHGYCISAALTTPRSRGSLRLASNQPGSAPVLDPNHYGDDHDYALMVTAVRAAREIGQAEALGPWRACEVAPGPEVDDDAGLRAYIAGTLGSINHPVGTCRIGADDLAVVDTALRVRGISGIRVADASVMPSIVTGYTIATVYAIAERAAELISEPAATTQHAMMRANS